MQNQMNSILNLTQMVRFSTMFYVFVAAKFSIIMRQQIFIYDKAWTLDQLLTMALHCFQTA
jgi:hypothetical protein